MKQQELRTNGAKKPAPPRALTARDHGELAAFLGCHPNTLSQWRRAGAPINGRGPHDVVALLKWIELRAAERQRRQEERAAEALRSADPDRAWATARAELARLRTDAARGALISTADHRRYVRDLSASLCAALFSTSGAVAAAAAEPDETLRLRAIEDIFSELLGNLVKEDVAYSRPGDR